MELNEAFLENDVYQGRQDPRNAQGRKGEIEEGRKGKGKVSFSLFLLDYMYLNCLCNGVAPQYGTIFISPNVYGMCFEGGGAHYWKRE